MKKLILLTLFICGCTVNNTVVNQPSASPSSNSDNMTSTSPSPVSSVLPSVNPSGTVSPVNTKSLIYRYDFSPDGKKIILDNNKQLFLTNSDGSNPKEVTTKDQLKNYNLLKWSPDGKKILVSSEMNNLLELSVLNEDGTNSTKITDNNTQSENPVWSPDSTKVAYISLIKYTNSPDYASYNPNQTINMIISDSDGKNKNIIQRFTLKDNMIKSLKWSPDGSKLAFINNDLLYIIKNDGTGLTKLVNSTTDRIYMDLNWSPDGSKIAFWVMENRVPKIYTINSDGINLKNISGNNSGDANPVWVNSKQIAFTSDTGIISAKGVGIMNLDGSNRQSITANEGSYSQIKVLSDNKISYILETLNGNDGLDSSKLFTINTDGSNKTLIIGN